MNDLVESARRGNPLARAALITSHLPIVYSLREPDCRSEGYLRLVQGVDAFLKLSLEPCRISAYLKGCVMQGAADVGRVEIRERVRVRKALYVGQATRKFGGLSHMFGEPTQVKMHKLVKSEDPVIRRLSAREELNACCWSDEDWNIIKFKLLGHSNKEAAKTLGISQQQVGRALENIRQRLTNRERVEKLCDDLNT